MWTYLVRFILRNRVWNIAVIVLLTAFMGWKATQVEVSYNMRGMLPSSDSHYIEYQEFKQIYGQDENVFLIGLKNEDIFNLEVFNDWYDLTYSIRDLDGVKEVISIARLFNLHKNDSTKKFDFKQIIDSKPASQKELDSIKNEVLNLPFFDGLIFNSSTSATVLFVTLDRKQANTKRRITLIEDIQEISNRFGDKHNIKLHYSGLPYIRTIIQKKVASELKWFVFIALIIASVTLFLFFRSFKAVLFPMLIVAISVIWSIGIISLMDYKITLLTSIIPPLVIIIGVENCIFLLNKYHHEFKNHGNKVKSLSRVVQRVGNATFLTNLTTATGFAAFIFTNNRLLVELGVVASLSIMVIFVLSLFLIPIFFSFLPPPGTRHLKHLDNRFTLKFLEKIVYLVQNKRTVIYVITVLVFISGIVGISQLESKGNMVDDISRRDQLYRDLIFFEEAFNGVLPLEFSIDTKKRRGVIQHKNLRKINQLQDSLAKYKEFSKALSLAEVSKFAKQAFYNGNPKYYSLPDSREKNFILSYIPKMKGKDKTIMNSFIDTNMQMTRVSVQMANINTEQIERIREELEPVIDQIFPPDDYDVTITGASMIFLEGSKFMVRSLLTSLLIAIIAISLLMTLLFTSFKMVVVSMSTNLLPQFMTAALMGFFAITIKPSTVLIFSIALGISVDNAIHFLARYRQQLRINNWRIKDAVICALRETGFSMIYSSIVLLLGFGIFITSDFGGTQSMGFLISFTLLVAVLSNLFVLPSLLLTLDKRITTKSFKEEPLIEILDEEDDIELENLEVEGPDTRGSA